jgi:hypothetical protein
MTTTRNERALPLSLCARARDAETASPFKMTDAGASANADTGTLSQTRPALPDKNTPAVKVVGFDIVVAKADDGAAGASRSTSSASTKADGDTGE